MGGSSHGNGRVGGDGGFWMRFDGTAISSKAARQSRNPLMRRGGIPANLPERLTRGVHPNRDAVRRLKLLRHYQLTLEHSRFIEGYWKTTRGGKLPFLLSKEDVEHVRMLWLYYNRG